MVASLPMRLTAGWATLGAYGLMGFPVNLLLRILGASDVVEAVVFSLVGFAVSVCTYVRFGGDVGKRVAGLRSLSFPSLEPIGLGQAAVRSLYLLAFGLGSVIDSVGGFDDGVLSLLVVSYLVGSSASIVLSDRNQSLSERLVNSVTVDTDPD